MEGLEALADILKQCRLNENRLTVGMYRDLPVDTIRFLREYLANLHKYHYYIEYSQQQEAE